MQVLDSDNFVLQVSEVTTQIKSYLEPYFTNISIEGEVSGLVNHSSGHTYFSLKDSKSVLSCTFFRHNAMRCSVKLKNGDKIIARGAIKIYEPRGTYSLNVLDCVYSGIGDLKAQYDRLKQDLAKKGYFNKNKPLPKYPKKIIFLTSKTGAALQDMIRVASNRFCLCEFILIDTLVQGSEAKYAIAKNLVYADRLNADIIVLARGGGSIEDLWCFNEIEVLEAIFRANTPIVSAIGHEIDYMLSDFVADVRAATPSMAMEMILCDKEALFDELVAKEMYLESIMKNIFQKKQEAISLRAMRIEALNPIGRISLLKSTLSQMASRLDYVMQELVSNKKALINKYQLQLVSLSPIALHKKRIYECNLRLHTAYMNLIARQKMRLQNLAEILTLKMRDLLTQKKMRLEQSMKILEGINIEKRVPSGLAEILKDNKRVRVSELKSGDKIEIVDSSGSRNAYIQ